MEQLQYKCFDPLLLSGVKQYVMHFFQDFSTEVVKRLWLYSQSSDYMICGAAYRALAHFSPTTFNIYVLPAQVGSTVVLQGPTHNVGLCVIVETTLHQMAWVKKSSVKVPILLPPLHHGSLGRAN